MRKKSIIIICLILISIVMLISFRKHYDIRVSPSNYSLRTEQEQKQYIVFIKKYIKPEKLVNFLNINHISFSSVRNCDSGYDAISWITFEAYDELFNCLFDKERAGYTDCPVTENFKNKFGDNLFEYFKFNNADDSVINCMLFDESKTLEVSEAGEFNVGEPGYIYYHHFHYTLDDEGNVDDIIFDYTE